MAVTPTEDLAGAWKQAETESVTRVIRRCVRRGTPFRRLRMDQPIIGSAPPCDDASAPRSTGKKRSSIRRAEINELRPLFSPVPFFFSPVPFSPPSPFSPVPFSPRPLFSPVPFSPRPLFSLKSLFIRLWTDGWVSRCAVLLPRRSRAAIPRDWCSRCCCHRRWGCQERKVRGDSRLVSASRRRRPGWR